MNDWPEKMRGKNVAVTGVVRLDGGDTQLLHATWQVTRSARSPESECPMAH
jgi:hypothetical protein